MGAPYGVELGEAPQIQLIQRLAYWLTLNGRTQMDRDHAHTIVTEAVPAVPEAAAHDDPGGVFAHLLHRSGLLREPTPGTVDFVHRTFQDYLAAKHLVDRWDIGVLISHAADDQWEDVVRMAVGHHGPASARRSSASCWPPPTRRTTRADGSVCSSWPRPPSTTRRRWRRRYGRRSSPVRPS